jgi:hypothetical protein
MADRAELDDRRKAQLREGILAAAAQLGVKAAKAGKANGLDLARMTDSIDVDGVTWHLNVSWAAATDGVQLKGHAVIESQQQAIDMGDYLILFGGNPEGFGYTVPAAWLDRLESSDRVPGVGG